MTYLRVRNFWEYQNADAWKKARDTKRGHPPWCKLYVQQDIELQQLPWEAEQLFYALLRVATKYANVFPNDSQFIVNETRIPLSIVGKHLPLLVKGRWVSQTKSSRPSREVLEKFAPRSRERSRTPKSPKARTTTYLLDECIRCKETKPLTDKDGLVLCDQCRYPNVIPIAGTA